MKDDDVEFENFDIDEYDLANALNPGRPRKRASKNQQTYGIWAEDSDDDEYRPSFGGGGQNMSSMAKEVSFVSGGLKQPVDASNLEKSDKADDEDEEENLDDEMIKAALSYSKLQAKKKHQSKMAGINREVAGLRSKKEQDFGSWEKYTKGIGQKLLLQMGYKPGKGLGKTLQGISEPVEAKKRSGKGTIGFYGSERTKTSLKHFPQDVTDEDEEKKFREKLQQWKKKPGETSKKKKFNYIYRTVDDVKADGMTRKLTDFSDGSHLKNKDKVIDMTGPKQRVLSGYESLQRLHVRPETSTESESTVKMPQAKSFEMDALVHNIDMLVDLSEQEIISSDRELQYHKDRIVALKHQEETISRVLENEKSQIDAIKELLKIVEEGKKAVDERGVEALDDLSRTFCLMQDEYYEEYMMFELADLSISIVFPLIKKKLEDWNPLEDDNSIRDIFKRWKDILEEGTTMNNYSERKDVELPDRYHRLVWEIWMPFVRKTITNTWSARDSDPLIEFLENWMPIIPQWITENILEQLALPRLQNEVDVWNPLTDTMPIHSWLHPWLPLMGEKLEPLYLPIRQKLGSALTCWHPSDGSAKLILQPWVQVFSKGTMQAFVVRHILPKLVTVLQEFVINPHQQHLDPWKWVMLWEEFLPLQSLVSLLDKNFFPQWTQVLCTWLNSDPDFEEVTKWYQGWKSMFSSQLLADRAIKDRFNQALDFMDRSVSQPSRPRFPQNNVGSSPLLNNVPRPPQRFNTHDNNQPYYPLPHRMPNNSPQRDYEAIMVRGASSAASVNMNFRDLIGHKAEENNLIFVPVPDRFYEGKQVYRFGHLLICIDRTVIFYLNPDNQMWLPTSIGNLLSMCI